ncbi:MAG: replicative DNA helicase [Streptomyces sp.]|nr:replicative DNA helicase [Streptomyces sp.]
MNTFDYSDEQATVNADHDAERAVLGAMMLDSRCIGDVAAIAPPATFQLPAHERIAEALIAMDADGCPTDPVSVHDDFVRRGQHSRIGGGAYLHRIYAAAPPVAQATYYAGIVRRWYQKRLLVTIGTRLTQMGDDPTVDLDDIPDLYAAAIKELDAGLVETPSVAIPSLDDLFETTIEGIEHPTTAIKVPTGIRDLDALLGGWGAGQLIIIAARPAIGKSTLALGAGREASIRHGVTTLLASLEMGADENMRRVISAEAKVGLHRINTNTLDDTDWARIASRQERITGAPFFIDETPNIGIGQLRHNAHEIRRRHGLGLIIVDYIQLMGTNKAENRQVEVSELSKSLKVLAKEMQVPVIALSQLNRGPESRTDKKPVMSDMRESGSLEQDADIVILMHREDAYDRESPRAGEVDLIVAKHRGGPTGTITCAFQGHYSRVADMAKTDDEPWTPHAAMRDAA